MVISSRWERNTSHCFFSLSLSLSPFFVLFLLRHSHLLDISLAHLYSLYLACLEQPLILLSLSTKRPSRTLPLPVAFFPLFTLDQPLGAHRLNATFKSNFIVNQSILFASHTSFHSVTCVDEKKRREKNVTIFSVKSVSFYSRFPTGSKFSRHSLSFLFHCTHSPRKAY